MVHPGRLPVDDAGQPAALGQQLVLVDVAMDQDRRQPGGAGQQACPRRGTIRAAQAGRGLGGGGRAGGRVKGPAQPAMMSGVVVLGRPRPGQPRRRQLMPAGDGLAQLLEQRLGFGRHRAGQAGYRRERERVDLRVVPAAQQLRHHGQPRPGQRLVGGGLSVEPLDPGGGTREQEHPVGAEQDQLVPADHVQHQPVQVHADERGEPRCLRWHQQGADRRSHEVVAHAQSMARGALTRPGGQAGLAVGSPASLAAATRRLS